MLSREGLQDQIDVKIKYLELPNIKKQHHHSNVIMLRFVMQATQDPPLSSSSDHTVHTPRRLSFVFLAFIDNKIKPYSTPEDHEFITGGKYT